jgi:hypothetical protein
MTDRAAYMRQYYREHRQVMLDRATRWRAEHHTRSNETRRQKGATVRAWLQGYKATHPCVDCGESDPIVLQFDHLPEFGRSSRRHCVSSRTMSWKALKEEIAKCEVVCANCHCRRTYSRRCNDSTNSAL